MTIHPSPPRAANICQRTRDDDAPAAEATDPVESKFVESLPHTGCAGDSPVGLRGTKRRWVQIRGGVTGGKERDARLRGAASRSWIDNNTAVY